jgi:hypothetical protein
MLSFNPPQGTTTDIARHTPARVASVARVLQRLGLVRPAATGGGLEEAKIGRREGIRFAQPPQGEILQGPRPDPLDGGKIGENGFAGAIADAGRRTGPMTADRVRARRVVRPIGRRSCPARHPGRGEQMRDSAPRDQFFRQSFAIVCDHAPGQRARRRHRNLLTEHRPHGKFEPVPAAWHPQSRPFFDQRAEQRVVGKQGGNCADIGIQVEQAAHPAADLEHLVARRAAQADLDPAAVPRKTADHQPHGIAQAKAPAIQILSHLLQPRNGARPEEREKIVRIERLAGAQAQDQIVTARHQRIDCRRSRTRPLAEARPAGRKPRRKAVGAWP